MMKIVRKNPKARRRAWLFKLTGGKCFYCGSPTYDHGGLETRDWIFLSQRSKHVREHMTPLTRGGADDRKNIVPACSKCNYEKGAFTVDEFRVARAFRSGTLSFVFAFEAPRSSRDWLCVHSRSFEKTLVVHNCPSAAIGYELTRPTHGPFIRSRAAARRLETGQA